MHEREVECVEWLGGSDAARWKYDYEIPRYCHSKHFILINNPQNQDTQNQF